MRYTLLLSLLGWLLATLATAQTTGSIVAPAETPTQQQSVPPAEAPTEQQSAPPPPPPPPSATDPVVTNSVPPVTAATGSSSTLVSSSTTKTAASGGNNGGSGGTGSTASVGNAGAFETNPPDVRLRIPNLSVGRIELDVDNLKAEVNLAAEVAKLVELNVGVQVGIQKVNITIAGVHAELELIIRLGHLVDIVNRTLQSLDLNPLLINLLDTVTDVVENVVGAVDGLLGSVIQGNTRLNFIIDNLGNIVQEVVTDAGNILSSIIGNYQQNMTYTGQSQDLGNGLTQKTYNYSPLGALVNVVLNGLNQVVQASVVKGGGTATSVTTPVPAAT